MMADQYQATGTASIHLRAQFVDDGSDLFDQAARALQGDLLPIVALSACDVEVDDVEEIEKPPTLGEIIKSKAARACAWVMGKR